MTREILLLLSGLLLFAACANTPVAAGADAPEKKASVKTYRDLLVFVAHYNARYRADAENAFVDVLASRGIDAESSAGLNLPLKLLMDENALMYKLRSSHYDGVLIVSTLDAAQGNWQGGQGAVKGIDALLNARPAPATEKASMIAWAASGGDKLYLGLWDVFAFRPVWETTTQSDSTGSTAKDNKVLAEVVAEQLKTAGVLE